MDAHGGQAPASRGTILVIEDDHDIRVHVRSLLEDEGYTVLSVADGRSALELLERTQPAPRLILLDLMLPVMDGWDFAARLRARPRLAGIPVVVMTAYDSPPPLIPTVAVVRKPIDADALLALVADHCA